MTWQWRNNRKTEDVPVTKDVWLIWVKVILVVLIKSPMLWKDTKLNWQPNPMKGIFQCPSFYDCLVMCTQCCLKPDQTERKLTTFSSEGRSLLLCWAEGRPTTPERRFISELSHEREAKNDRMKTSTNTDGSDLFFLHFFHNKTRTSGSTSKTTFLFMTHECWSLS